MKKPILPLSNSLHFHALTTCAEITASRENESTTFTNVSVAGSYTAKFRLQLLRIIAIGIVVLLFSFGSGAQTYVGMNATPADNSALPGPTVSVAPPATMQIGDLVVLFAAYRATTATFSISAAANQQWAVATAPTGGTNTSYAIYWCRYNGAWIGNPAVTVGTGTNAMSLAIYAYRPTSNTKGWAIVGGPSTTTIPSGTGTTITITGHTTTAANTVSMAFWATPTLNTWGTLTAGWTKPGGIAQYRNSTNPMSHTSAYKVTAAAGATGTVAQARSAGTTTAQGSIISWAEGNPPANDFCTNASLLTSAATCVTTGGSLNYSLFTSDGGPSTCNTGAADVWYKFVAKTSNPRITNALTSGSGQRRTELYEGSCGTLVSKACSGDNDNLNATGLLFGQTYYIRVYSENASPYNYNICVQDIAPTNGTCSTPVTLTPATSCVPVGGNLDQANQTNPLQGCGNYWDVWYQFTAPAGYTFANITVTPTGMTPALTAANTFLEVFKSNCGSINNNSLSCSNIGMVRSVSIATGTVYLFRVYTTTNPNTVGANYNFNICISLSNSFVDRGSRMQEVFKQTILSPPNVLNDPWEIIYGPDNNLWITESKGYKVYKMDPTNGNKVTVLDISQNATFLPLADRPFNCQFANGAGAQGGLAGMVLHPEFLKGTGHDYAYVSYIHTAGATLTYPNNTNPCRWFTNRLVRFTYNTTTQTFGSPVSVCDTLPGSNDHNSQRVTVAKVGGVDYIFYAAGDMGAGQLDCYGRIQKSQLTTSYEGKILRFRLDPVGTATVSDNWIPTDNPYDGGVGARSAVWVTGIRNNQGFVYDSDLDILYGASHGPYSDDEINVIEKGRNYGHPLVIGYVSDGNYNGDTTIANQKVSAGAPMTHLNYTNSTNRPIGSESGQRDIMNTKAVGLTGLYKDPLFSGYPELASGPGSVKTIWQTNPNNGGWPSEGWSGLDLYTNSMIPGWKKSLVAASLKWGRLVRLKLGASGLITVPSNNPVNNAGDTVNYFGSINRFRDLAFAPNGRDIYVIMDKSTTTSGPSAQWPVVPACQGCLQKYTFLGYNPDAGNLDRSFIPSTIPIAPGTADACEVVNKIAINAANDNNDLWVPITDNNSNVVAEIYAMGQNLDTVRTSIYRNTNPVRIKSGRKYLDRNITITPDVQPGGEVRIRLYITQEELDDMINSSGSGVTGIADLKIVKNNDPCGSSMTAPTIGVAMDFNAETFGAGYVLQGRISSFSTFYFGSAAMATLPLELLTFKGSLQNNNTLLQWETAQEINTSHFIVERSLDGSSYTQVGTVTASGNTTNNTSYTHTDYDAGRLPVTTIYYRLRMVDKDGQYTYSNIIHVNLPYVAGKVSITPNPVIDFANVSITAVLQGRANWKLVDNTGRIVMRGTTMLQTGNNQIMINMNRQPAGIYFLDVSGVGVSYQVKMQKL